MKRKQPGIIRALAFFLALLLVINLPVSAFASEETSDDSGISLLASAVKEEMLESDIFKALLYLGYDSNGYLRNNDLVYETHYYGSSLLDYYPNALSDVPYDTVGNGSGAQTSTQNTGYTNVTSATGKYPNVTTFKSTGLDCADFAAYYLTNYLPNIVGTDISALTELKAAKYSSYTYDHMEFWPAARQDMINAGFAKVYTVESVDYDNGEISKYTDPDGTVRTDDIYSHLKIGTLIQMGNESDETLHYAIYAGTYNGKHFMIHSGNADRGPEISLVEYMSPEYSSSSKASVPLYFYEFDFEFEQYGNIEIYKKDPNGNALAGAKFLVIHQKTNTATEITTNSKGYAILEELPYGTYKVTETVAPTGYIKDDTVWTVTLDENTPNGTITINAVNKKNAGNLRIRKITSTGTDLAGWQFKLYTNSASKAPYLASNTANRSYRVKITDKYGNVVYSDPAHLSIGPHITQQPVSQSVAAGTSTSISVKAEGTGLTYQWQYKYVGTSTWTNSSSTSSGAYTDTFTFTMASSFNNRQYRCVITDSSGNVTYSEAATLYLPTTLAILTQPESVVSNVADKASFAVKASGSNLKYQWQASSNGGTSWNNIGTMSTYTGTKTTTPALLLRCVISDGTNTVTTDTVQWVRSDYKNASGSSLGICIVEQPEDYVGKLNSTASFDVLAAGEGLVYQWEYLVDTDETQTWLSAETLYSSTEYETGADGTVLITDIPVGSYYVKEINDGKAGWVYDLVPKAVEVTLDHTTDAPAEVTFTNTLANGTITVNKIDEAGNPLAGAGFVAVGSDGSRYEFPLTDSLGTATVSVPYDSYTITEIIFPEGFEAGDVTEWTVTVSSETQHKSITAENKEKKGTLTANKVDENGDPLAGAGFVAVAEDGTRYEFPLTDTAGSAAITVPFGSYTIYEVVFPEGYEAGDVTSWSVIIDDDTPNHTCSFTAVNKLITGSLTFRKATTTGNGVELGWTAKLWRIEENGDWTYIGSGTTRQDKADPTYTWTGLIPGRYVLQEDPDVTHPGFAVDTEYHYIDVVGNDTATVTITNTELGKGRVIKQMADGSSPAGWTFDIYRVSDNSHVGTYVTGEDGTFTTKFLMPGDYLIVEQIPEDSIYECVGENPQTFTVVAGETASVTFTNALRPGKISIEKINSEGEKLAGAKFLLEWSNDGGTTWTAVTYNDSPNVILGACTTEGLIDGCLTTDSTGIITFDGLHPGLMYRVTELEAPEGYLLLADFAFVGELPVEDLTVSLTVNNSRAYTYPASGSTEMTNLAAAGTFLAVLAALMSTVTLLSSKPVFSVKNHVENKFKGENKQ